MSKLIVAALVFSCFAIEAPAALAKNNQSVTGGFTSRFERIGQVTIRKVNINVARHKSGKLTGGIKLTDRIYVNGVLADQITIDAKADDLIVIGNRAYVKAGDYYFVVEDNGEGSKADPDKNFGITLIGNPPLALLVLVLDSFLNGVGFETIKGNAQVRK